MYSVNNKIVLNMPLSEVHETMAALVQRAIEIENEYGYEEREDDIRLEIGDKSFTPSYIVRYFQDYDVYPIYEFFSEIEIEGEEKMVFSIHSGTAYEASKDKTDDIIRQKLVEGKIIESVKLYGVHPEAGRIDIKVSVFLSSRGEKILSLEQAEIITEIGHINELRTWEKQFYKVQCEPVKKALHYLATDIVSAEYKLMKDLKRSLKHLLG